MERLKGLARPAVEKCSYCLALGNMLCTSGHDKAWKVDVELGGWQHVVDVGTWILNIFMTQKDPVREGALPLISSLPRCLNGRGTKAGAQKPNSSFPDG